MHFLLSRYTIFRLVLLLTAACAALGWFAGPVWYWPLVVLGPLA